MKKGLITLTLLLCLAAFTISLVNVHAQTTAATPGVKAGEIYIFSTYSYWTSSNAYDSIPTELQTVNQTQAVEVRISDANDTFVDTFTATYYYDRSPEAGRGSTNVNTGAVSGQGFAAIIGGNLNQGQYIHPLATDGIYINQTAPLAGRPANEIVISVTNQTTGITSTSDRFFDQATGMLVKDVESTVDGGAVSGQTSTTSVTVELKSSPWNPQNVTIPEFQPIYSLPLFIGATTLILIAVKKKHMLSGHPAVKA